MNDVLFPDYKHLDNFGSVGALTTFQFVNLYSIILAYRYFYNPELDLSNNIHFIIFIILGINYFLLQHKGKDKKICQYYKARETNQKRNVGLFFAWVYIIGTWVAFLFVANL